MMPLRCHGGLNGLTFFVGAIQTVFGAFFTVYLTLQGWSQTDIGLTLSIGTASSLLFQLPAGALVDAIDLKRLAIAIALVMIGIAAIVILVSPTEVPVLIARVMQGFAGCLITPAIAALTLKLCGHDLLSERLGINGRYASLGNAIAAAALGAVAYYLSEGAIFTFTALMVIPALATLLSFRTSDTMLDDHLATHPPQVRKEGEYRPWHIFHDPIMHLFAVCVVLFHLANAAMLPLALNELSKRIGNTGIVVSLAIIAPQLVSIAFSPMAGRVAQTLGRRPVLLVGFAALPVRGLLFMFNPDPLALVAIELLDGVSATVFNLTMPLIAADLTRQSGYMNLAIGSFGLAAGIGATASTTVGGWLADNLGASAAFFVLALVGVAALTMLWRSMPETRPGGPMIGKPAVVAA